MSIVTEDILGFPVAALDVDQCVDAIVRWIRAPDDRAPRVFVCANPHSLVTAMDDAAFADALRGADLVTADGIGVVLASRAAGGAVPARVTGSDVFHALHARLAREGGARVFFLGASEATLADIRARMAVDHPAIEVVGTCSPPFKPEFSAEDDARMVAAINAARPDVLWVAMTAPKQEKWIHANRGALDVRFIGAVGAVFDFYTGRIKRSPVAFQKLGLEWLPRLVQEPRRLWRRNFVSGPRFLAAVARRSFGGRP